MSNSAIGGLAQLVTCDQKIYDRSLLKLKNTTETSWSCFPIHLQQGINADYGK